MRTWDLACQWMKRLSPSSLLGGVVLLLGCASTSTSTSTSPAPPPKEQKAPKADAKIPPLPPGVTLRSDLSLQGVWLADGCTFKGYDALLVTAPVFSAIERPNEVDMRTMALQVLPEQLATHLRDTKLFATVTTRSEEVKPDARSLKMHTRIIEYEQGSTAGRIFAGPLGGGQPVIKVRGEVVDGDKLLCVYEVRRSGASDEAKFLGGGKSHEEIQRDDIRVLARDVADFFKRTANAP